MASFYLFIHIVYLVTLQYYLYIYWLQYYLYIICTLTAVTFPLLPPRLAFAICGRRWQNDVYEIKYSVCDFTTATRILFDFPFIFKFW